MGNGTQTVKKCDVHETEYPVTIRTILGRSVSSPCPLCMTDAEREQSRQSAIEDAKIFSQRMSATGLGARYRDCTLESYRVGHDGQRVALNIVQRYCESLPLRVSEGDSIVLFGGVGTGKTHLAAAIIHEALGKMKFSAIYITIPKFQVEIRSIFHSRDESLKSYFSSLESVDILVIDEVGELLERDISKWFFNIIDTRYANRKPTILISNLNKKDLGLSVGDRIYDRIFDGKGYAVNFDWESYRGRK